ncbi:hypothetical protein [Actinophytocola sp. NPDC049390]|uniref:hypothetical protein n=1 Tax=Actinophytocola sp. NPDC049390 TaxID=3363894 RepID=UPI00379BFF13
MTPHEIYQALTTGPGSERVDAAQRTAKILWEDEDERAELIRRQGELIRSGWQGSASDGAFGAAQPLAASALNRVDELARAEDLLDRQSGSFNRAKNEVRPVPADPPGIDLTDPNVVFSDYEKQIVAYQADAHHNIEVFSGYDNASSYNETNIPAQYSSVNGSGGTISVTADGARPSDTGDYIEVRDQPRPGGESGPYGGPGGSPVSGPPVGGSPVSGPVPSPSLPQQTTPSTYVPPAVNPPGPYPPNPYQPTPGGPGQPGYGPGVPVGGYPGGGPGGRGGYGGGYGPRGGGGYGPGTPGPGARAPMAGPGPAAGAIPAEEAAARRAAAAAAGARGAGPGGMAGAPMGAGRGKGDEDEEHQRKVLIEADSEAIFGSDVLTAPQVIGDDEYEDD